MEEVTNRVRPQVIGEHSSATKGTAFKHGSSRIKNQKVPQWYVDEKRYDATIKKIEARHQRNLDRESAYAALTAGQREMRFRNVQLFWQRSSDLLLHRWRISYRIEIARNRCRTLIWRRLVQRLLRRYSELLHFVCLRKLIQPWLAVSSWGTFPAKWPAFTRRRVIHCPICVSGLIRGKSVFGMKGRCKPQHRWDVRLRSFWFSFHEHVLRSHTDIGGRRFCVVCCKLTASIEGCVTHQVLKHLSVAHQEERLQDEDGCAALEGQGFLKAGQWRQSSSCSTRTTTTSSISGSSSSSSSSSADAPRQVRPLLLQKANTQKQYPRRSRIQRAPGTKGPRMDQIGLVEPQRAASP